jgi:hypothetical protein
MSGYVSSGGGRHPCSRAEFALLVSLRCLGFLTKAETRFTLSSVPGRGRLEPVIKASRRGTWELMNIL